MAANSRAVALVLAMGIATPMEGLRQWAYRDPGPAIWTICYGHTKDVKQGDYKTEEQCKELLMKEMGDAINAVDKCRPNLPPPVLAAFADAAYNLGEHIACDSSKSTAARMLAAKDYKGACNQLPRWNMASVAGVKVELPGLTKRREMERELCLSY